jgi:hypothetical protein
MLNGFLGPVTNNMSFGGHAVVDASRLNVGPMQFYVAIAGGLLADDQAALAAGYAFMDNSQREDPWHEECIVELGTAEVDHAVARLAAGLVGNLKMALRRMADVLHGRLLDPKSEAAAG